MHFDDRDIGASSGLRAKLSNPRGIQICVTGFDVVDRNNFSDFIAQNDIGSDGALLAVPCIALRKCVLNLDTAQILGLHRVAKIVMDSLPVFRSVSLAAGIYDLLKNLSELLCFLVDRGIAGLGIVDDCDLTWPIG